MRTLALLVVLLAPARALASCESIISVQSRALNFRAYDTISDGPMTAEQIHAHFRGLARSLAVARACFESAGKHAHGTGTPPRTEIVRSVGRPIAAGDSTDVDALWILRRVHPERTDSTCVLWTCELARFETDTKAREFRENLCPPVDSVLLKVGWNRRRNASILFETCAGYWEPGPFIVQVGGKWALRGGLYMTREDAVRAAKAWGPKVNVVRQHVDGPLLELALAEPIGDC
jgi:hypothetical protein